MGRWNCPGHTIHTLTIISLLVVNPFKKFWLLLRVRKSGFYIITYDVKIHVLYDDREQGFWICATYTDCWVMKLHCTMNHITMDFKSPMTSQYPLPSGLNCKYIYCTRICDSNMIMLRNTPYGVIWWRLDELWINLENRESFEKSSSPESLEIQTC